MTALSPVVPQSWRRVVVLLPLVLIALAVTASLLNGPLPRPKFPKVSFQRPESPSGSLCGTEQSSDGTTPADDIPNLLRTLWSPTRLSVTSPEFVTLDGTLKRLPPAEELIHKQPLGKRICILDVDNRPLDEQGDIFANNTPTAENMLPRTAGFLSHYLYAQIHNYSYRFVRAPSYADRAPHWAKVIFTQELLKQFDIVVMMDYDAMFPSPEVPLEWMLNYWKLDRDVIVAMAEDPNVDVNLDARGRLNINTGFIIAQASDNAQRMFKDWAECPEETRYKDCGQWKNRMFHEQAGFSSYVRYDFLDGLTIEEPQRYIRTLPCNEANGVPMTKDLGCTGQLVRHFWAHKPSTPLEFTHNLMHVLTPLLAKAAFGDVGHVLDYRDKVLQGDEILEKQESKAGA
ncbi:hypothetical protein B0T16DRAFT_334822 [Cercophora newfieldiana]|uniref:Nucleotide-diphospho-sugar transferase domain-containing protein n=1 Tax=Cercophora newfieldiana TaxID=92897 RepID=A0AA39XUQ3_9PEZI|nr:hypothetical protein B0T16DRAFT_334822 [Cercophora newfieldiana]